jgi:hypothetical protein
LLAILMRNSSFSNTNTSINPLTMQQTTLPGFSLGLWGQ